MSNVQSRFPCFRKDKWSICHSKARQKGLQLLPVIIFLVFVLHAPTEETLFFWRNMAFLAWLCVITPDEKFGSGHVLFLMCWLQLIMLSISNIQLSCFLCHSYVKCRLLVRAVAVNVNGQAQHFNSWHYSCVSSKLGLQTGGRNVKSLLVTGFRRSFILESALGKVPCNLLKLSVLEISSSHLHFGVWVFLWFKKTPNTLSQPAEEKLPQNCHCSSSVKVESLLS